MTDFSQAGRDVIAKQPLNGSLEHLRDTLQRAEQSRKHDTTSDDATADQGTKKAVSRLLYTLQGHEAALELQSRTGNRNVASELATIFGRVQGGDFNYDHYRPLAQLVIKKAPDVDIWSAVLDLITSLSRTTPPASIPPSFDGTPVTYSSASQQGSEQTKKLLEPLILHEFRYCTYRAVEGFVAKYFEGKKWSGRVQEIYTSLRERHVDGHWIDFPDPPDEDAVWRWWSGIQEEYLSDASGVYYTTSSSAELTGAEAKRQLDLFIKRRTDKMGATHDWKDVRVIGEHRVSKEVWRDKFLQVGRYVRDVYFAQPTRRFVHAFTLLGTTMELWVFDRSGPYSSGPFDIHEEPQRFIQALAGYSLMSDEELGLDNVIEEDGEDRFISITEDATGNRTKVQVEPQPMVLQRAIVCRGTTCFRSKDRKKVVKLSWPSDLRPPETDHLRRARDHGVEGVATLFGSRQLTSIQSLREGLVFPAPHRFRKATSSTSVSFSESQSQVSLSRSFGPFQSLGISQNSLGKRKSIDKATRDPKRSQSNSQPSKLREVYKQSTTQAPNLRINNTSKTEPLPIFSSIKGLLTALCDAIKAHLSLFCKAKILHRDISENNIIITDPVTMDGWTGMLIDLDLAIVNGDRTGPRHQTGTMEFMAIDVLRGVAHTYRHDLESFFYVLLWICARRAWEREFECTLKKRPADSVLSEWYGSNFKKIARHKEHDMGVGGFKAILEEFPPTFDGVKPLCREVRTILFPLTKDGELDLSTPADPQILYGPIIKAFKMAIADTATEDS